MYLQFSRWATKVFLMSTCLLLALGLANNAGAVPVNGQGTWEATLHARDLNGDGTTDAFYDSLLNITWLRNANVNSSMTWVDANNWAAGFSIGKYSDWRLPTVTTTVNEFCYGSYSGTDCGFNVNTDHSEMAHLYYVTLGNSASRNPDSTPRDVYGLVNSGQFENFVPFDYWTGTPYAPFNSQGSAWYFGFGNGQQLQAGVTTQIFALAVRDGDIPEPETAHLLVAAICALAFIRFRAQGK